MTLFTMTRIRMGMMMTLLKAMIITLLKSLIMTLLKILFFQAPQAFSHDAALAAHAEAERQVFDLFHRVSNKKSIFSTAGALVVITV